MTSYQDAAKRFRSLGVDLEYGRQSPGNWRVLNTERVGPYTLSWSIAPEFFSGFELGTGQQTVGGFGEAGLNKFGIEVQLRVGEEVGSDRVLENAPFVRQQELFQELVSTLRKIVNPPSSPKLVGMTPVQSPLNPTGRPWRIGDVVNVSRPTHDGGALSLGIVTRIYPTTNEVTWEPDAQHPTAWTTTEKHKHLILIRNDANWRTTVNRWYGREEYTLKAESLAPSWTKLVTMDKELLPRSSPLPYSQDFSHERTQALKEIDIALEPYEIYERSELSGWNESDLISSRRIKGFSPYQGLFPRSL